MIIASLHVSIHACMGAWYLWGGNIDSYMTTMYTDVNLDWDSLIVATWIQGLELGIRGNPRASPL